MAPERVDLRRDEVLHQILLDEGVAEPEVPLVRRVRERARRGVEERVRRAGRGSARTREEVGVTQVVDERVATGGRHRAGGGVAADVAVHLLRPVADVLVRVRPERRILEPLLGTGLVGPDAGHALADPHDPDDALRRRPLAARVVEAAEELAQVRAAVPVAAAHRGGDLVDRPAVARADVEAGGRHLAPRVDARLVPGRPRVRDPLLPRRQVDLGERVEGRAERADLRCAWPGRCRVLSATTGGTEM